jgi:hypothetical protein
VVRAKAVIVAAGTLYTPSILRASGLKHPWIGKNLSIHPATKVMAAFDDVVDQSRGIPQGYAIEDLAGEGIMLEGGSAPFDVTAIGVPYVGHRFMEVMANFPRMATFGMMVQDVSRGSIHVGPGGKPILKYDLGSYDLARLQKGVVKLSEIFRAAGAKKIYPFVVGSYEVHTQGEIDALARRKLRPGDIEVMGFHPLGTARVGTDTKRSVLSPDHETREVGGLYVMDGAAVPSSLGVNPQMTIMAMSLRACEQLSAKLK